MGRDRVARDRAWRQIWIAPGPQAIDQQTEAIRLGRELVHAFDRNPHRYARGRWFRFAEPLLVGG